MTLHSSASIARNSPDIHCFFYLQATDTRLEGADGLVEVVCKVRPVLLRLCRIVRPSSPIGGLLLSSSCVDEGLQDGIRLIHISELPHTVVTRAQEGHLCPR